MDVISILVGLGLFFLLIATVITLIYILNINSKDTSPLDKLAESNNLNLETTEVSSSLLLALDRNNRKLIVVEPKNHEQSLIIDLRKISSCELKKINSPEKKGSINFISLNLIDREAGKTATEIIFYDDFDVETRNRLMQLQMAKRWRRYVEEAIK